MENENKVTQTTYSSTEKAKKCKYCQSDIPMKAKICPVCKKKLKPSGCLTAIIAFIVIVIIASIIGGGDDSSKTSSNTAQSTTELTNQETITETESKVEEPKAEEPIAEEPIAETTTEPEAETDKLTMSQKNALSKAENYLSLTAFSYSGLIKQLEFEKFSTEDATYAADNCGADWNEQAALKAQDYLDLSAFSRDSLITQLEFEGFTSEQAEYGVTAVGY